MKNAFHLHLCSFTVLIAMLAVTPNASALDPTRGSVENCVTDGGAKGGPIVFLDGKYSYIKNKGKKTVVIDVYFNNNNPSERRRRELEVTKGGQRRGTDIPYNKAYTVNGSVTEGYIEIVVLKHIDNHNEEETAKSPQHPFTCEER